MASNRFGTLFCITTWGESHGEAIGVVIDGCPSGLEITVGEIESALEKRAPGRSALTSERKETDRIKLLSGVFEGKTTGAPISILIANRDANSDAYTPVKEILKPGHANYTYLEKYGVFDYRGGGRASARETACRVAAGAIAKKLLKTMEIDVVAYLKSVGEIKAPDVFLDPTQLKSTLGDELLPCHDQQTSLKMAALIKEVKEAGDSIGGVVEFITSTLPVGFGDPVYEKLEANLAKAMLSLPASKGFEIGEGFKAPLMRGSCHNDLFQNETEKVTLKTNYAGGTLGGISNGSPVIGRVAFKPASSIAIAQESIDVKGNKAVFKQPENSRHDPCVAIRAVPVVEAMAALVLADALLMNKVCRL